LERESGGCNDELDIDAMLEELEGLDWDNGQDWWTGVMTV
jgi:hypothetical protein